MKWIELYDSINSLFETRDNKAYFRESGITVETSRDIKRVGYCVNLTLETAEEAIFNNVDLMITHHNAWENLYEMHDACSKKLKEHNIGHYYNHLPLDDCKFGTNERLAQELGLDVISKNYEYEGFYCGRVGEYKEPIDFTTLIKRMENILDEPVKSWKFNDKKIKRVGIEGLAKEIKRKHSDINIIRLMEQHVE